MSDETQRQQPTPAPAGHAPQGHGYPPAGPLPPARPSNGLAIAALITGLAALLVCLIPFINVVSVLAGLAGVVLGLLGLRAARQRQGSGRGMSIAGLITGAIAVVVATVVLTLTVQAMMRVAEQTSDLTRLAQDLERMGETGGLPDITGLPGLEDLEGIEGLEGLGLEDLARGLEDLALPGLTAPEPTTVVAMGEPVADGDLEFTVTGHQSAETVGEGAMPEQADGEYVLVDITVRNTGAAATMFVGTLQMLVDDQGTAHMVDLQTLVGTPDPTLAGTLAGSLEPGETVEGTLVYDLPAGAAPERLVLTGTMLSTAVAVDLG